MTPRMNVITSVLGTLIAGSAAAVTLPQMTTDVLLAQSWQHVATRDAATGADVSELFPRLAGKVEYRQDGTYVFGDGADRGAWTLSADGQRLVIASATFEYGVELAVKRLDASGLHVASRMVSADGTTHMVVESFMPAGRFLQTSR